MTRIFLRKGEKIVRQQRKALTQDDWFYGPVMREEADYVEPWKVLNAVWGLGAKHILEFLNLWSYSGGGMLVFRDVNSSAALEDIFADSMLSTDSMMLAATNLNVHWLRFACDGKELLAAQRPLLHSISWDEINKVDAAYGKDITIDGKSYFCRLLTGANGDHVDSSLPKADDLSEWNRLIQRIYQDNNATKPDSWAMYDATYLGFGGSNERGRLSWCKESDYLGEGRICRGHPDSNEDSYIMPSYHATSRYGYRPVLELLK